jgi:hypothetical protein
MSTRKPSSIATKIAATFAVAALSLSAFAGRYWVAADNSDALWSNTANWSDQKDGTSGATEPGDGTGTIYFCKYKNGATIFDKLGVGPGNVQIGTQDERYFVWSATNAAYGLDATGKELQICQNISNSDRTPAKLQIDSGTYKFGKVFVSYIAKGTAELLLNGGTVTTTASGADILGVCMIASGLETTTGKLTIDGGALDCTSGDFFSVGGRSNTTATVHLKSGSLTAKGFLLGGRGGHKSLREVDNAVASMILDGGTLTTSGECAIGDSYGSGTSSEMIINSGATYNCNYGYFYVGEAGPGTLTMNGGTFTMQDSSDGGLSFGRAGNGKDVGTLVLNGGVLTTSKIRLKYVQSGSRIVFNGGTLKPTRGTSSFLEENANLTCEVQEGGLVFDTAGMDVGIRHPLTGSGPLIKKGSGTLTVSDATPFTSVIVYGGTAVVGGTTYGVNAEAAIDASAGGDLGEVVIHREKLEGWLKDADFRNVAKYDAAGTAMMEQPEPVIIDVNGNRKTYINLETGKTYNDEISGTAFSFTTENLAPRTLQIIAPDNDPVENVRDIGSYPLLGGGNMNQGVILRGGHLDHFVNATPEQRTASFLTSFGLKTEIELRGAAWDLPPDYKDSNNEITVTDSFAADDCAYVYCGMGYGDDNGTQIRADDNGNFTNQIRKVFATWGTEGKLPSYFHCRIGTDRTGIVGLLLLSVMGVEEEVLYRDYLMSNFANIGGSRDTNVPDTFIRYLLRGNCNDGKYVYDTKDAQYGVSIASRARQYLEMCGVTEEQLGVITAALSGETPAEVLARVNAYEQANNVRTVTYYPYEGSSDVKGVHRLPAGEHMLPVGTPVRDGYVFKGWDTENESDGIVYALWESSADQPKKLKWDNNAGDRRLANGDNWYIDKSDPKEYSTPRIIDDCEWESSYAALLEDETFSAKSLYFGQWGNPGTIDITNGTFTVANDVTLGHWGMNSKFNIFDGDVTVKRFIVGNWGSHDNNTLNIYGGNVTLTGEGSPWPGTLVLGLQNESRGDMLVKGGTVTVNGGTKVGFSNLTNIGGPTAGYNSSITVDGGSLSASGTIDVADSDSGNGGGGRVYVKSGSLSTTGDLNISVTSNSWGQVDITGGNVTVGGTIRVGNHAYAQHATLNIAGGTLTAGTVSVARQCDAWVRITDGGTLYADKMERAQGAPSSANPHYYFDDATFVTTSGYDYNLASAASITIGAGGLTIDSNGFDSKIQAYPSIDGVGGITKKGQGRIEFVANSFGFAGTYNARGMIVVEEGTLKLPANQTIYCAGTQVAEGATLDLNGSTIIVVTKEVVESIWTNATGDCDAANPANWRSTVKYFDIYGAEVVELTETLDGVLPTSASNVRISVDLAYPTNLDPATVKSVTYVSSRDMSLVNDFAATFDNYAAPSLELSGDVKIMSNFNGLLNSAVAWYDPSDAATLKLNADGTVNGLVNKGRLGSALDFEPMGSTSEEKTMPIIERPEGWQLDCISFATTNRGFKTAYTSSLAGDKTLICVDRHVDGEWYPFLANSDDVFGWIGACEVFGASLFRYYVNGGNDWGNVLNMNGAPGTGEKNTIHSIRVASKAVKADLYYAADDKTYSGSTDVVDDLISENMLLCMGERSWWNGNAQHGYVGESLAFDSALSDAAVDVVRQYLAAKWLGGDYTVPSAGTTSFDSLILKGSNVDMDGAAVSAGIFGGDGSITNCASLRITVGFACDVDGAGNAPKIVVDCDVDATGTTVADISDALSDIVNGGTVATLVETTGKVTMPSRIRIKHGAHDYVIYKAVSGEKAMICLAKDLGFTIRLR